jgi:hypothetical protein
MKTADRPWKFCARFASGIARRKKSVKIRLQVMKISLFDLAHARSGDKGDTANVGVIALRDEYYPILVREVTAERVKEHFGEIVKGRVERFELPNLKALNFLLHESLGGGGTLSLMTDAQGKTFSTALLRMKIEISEVEAKSLGLI